MVKCDLPEEEMDVDVEKEKTSFEERIDDSLQNPPVDGQKVAAHCFFSSSEAPVEGCLPRLSGRQVHTTVALLFSL